MVAPNQSPIAAGEGNPLRAALDALPSSIVLLDERGAIFAVNRAWRDFGEHNGLRLPDAGLGTNYLTVCDDARGDGAVDAAAVAEAVRDVLSGSNQEHLLEYTCHAPDERHWFSVRITGSDIGGGRGAVVIHQDVTDRRKLEQARRAVERGELEAYVDARTRELRAANERLTQTEKHLLESEARFRAAASSTADLIVEADLLDDRLRWFGDVDALLGYEFGEFPRTSSGFFEHFHPDDREQARQEVERAFNAGDTFRTEYRVRCKDGSYRHWESRGRVVADRDGQPSRAVGAHRDITERKRQERDRQSAEAELQAVMAALSDYVWSGEICNGEFRYRYYSPPVEAITGYPPSYFMEGPERWLGTVHPDDRQRLRGAFERTLNGSLPEVEEYRITRPDGAVRWVRDSVKVEQMDDGTLRAHGVVSDVTDAKFVEQALRDRELKLRHNQTQLRELTARLFSAQEDERRRLARELHDSFNQQIAAMSIQLGSLRQRHPDLLGDIRRELAAIQDGVVQLSNDIRRVSHELHPAALDQLGLVAALKAHCVRVSEQDQLNVAFNCDSLPSRLARQVSVCIFRVAQEALRNVGRHSGSRRAEVTLRRADGGLELCVVDHGKGFEVGGARQKGRVGLVGMEERVRPLGGRFSVTSRPGSGTEISVFVPVEPEEDDDAS